MLDLSLRVMSMIGLILKNYPFPEKQNFYITLPIMITSPCNEYPLTPHFYIVKLGFTGVYIIFLFLL